MKILHFKIPVILERNPTDKSIKMTIDEDRKEQIKEEDLGSSTQDIVKLSKSLSDENEMTKSIARECMFASETKVETSIVIKILAE